MFKFIQKLFSVKKGKRTVVILNDDGTEEYAFHKFRPRNLWVLCLGILAGIVVLVVFLMIFTPLSGLIYNQEKMRHSVIAIQQQVAALQDSIKARNMQLQNLRNILFSKEDTVFRPIQSMNGTTTIPGSAEMPPVNYHFTPLNEFQLSGNALLISNLLKKPEQFPARWPVEGILTRGYNSSSGHYGIDIAANKGEYFHAIADGVVIGADWGINYGNVLYIQHSNGIITVYKHASMIVPNIGDIVSKGDILGRVGNTGIISTGPHLHMEIWANGIPQNPLHYLVKS